MRILLLAVAIALAVQATDSARAQTYPSRPITMIVPFAAGGPTDRIGRIMAEGMRGSLQATHRDRGRVRGLPARSGSAVPSARRPTAIR